jgi:16S rRNA (cytidine1402-2'-O)-methyltransferase
MSGVLYIVATPIGNLDDITLRAIEVLGNVDLVAAEDTRHSQHLMAHLGLRKKMLSLHEHNEQDRIIQILALLSQGQQIALVSDAGTPLISDPGFPLVRAAIEAGYKVTPIPGVSSIIAALSAAGLATDQFSYHGFLAHKNADRLTRLQALKQTGGTHVLLESTHRIERLL